MVIMKKKGNRALENIVMVAIFLVLIQTFMEDLAVLLDMRWNTRLVLIFAGFVFDLFFTVEFLGRFYNAFLNGKAGDYVFREKGWLDFLASIPLLLLNSGPAVISIVTGTAAAFTIGGFINIIKIVKAVRIARVLRLLRVLKIFKQIKYADSPMAQRHLSKVLSIVVTGFVVCLFAGNLVFSIFFSNGLDQNFTEGQKRAYVQIHKQFEQGASASAARQAADIWNTVLVIQHEGTTLYSRHDSDFYTRHFGISDYIVYGDEDLRVFFNFKPFNIHQSRNSLIYFAVIMVILLIFVLYYSPHFAITVTDPVNIMRKGMESKSYNLEVKIPEKYREDDIFKFADVFNNVYLPLKDRTANEENDEITDIKMEDYKNLF